MNGWAPADPAWADAGWGEGPGYGGDEYGRDDAARQDPAGSDGAEPTGPAPGGAAPWQQATEPRWGEPGLPPAGSVEAEPVSGPRNGYRPDQRFDRPPRANVQPSGETFGPPYGGPRDDSGQDRLVVPAQRPPAGPSRPDGAAGPALRYPTGELPTADAARHPGGESPGDAPEPAGPWSGRPGRDAERPAGPGGYGPPPGFRPQPEYGPGPDRVAIPQPRGPRRADDSGGWPQRPDPAPSTGQDPVGYDPTAAMPGYGPAEAAPGYGLRSPAQPFSAPPASAPPSSVPPASAPPFSAPPASAPPFSAPPASAPPYSAPPAGGPAPPGGAPGGGPAILDRPAAGPPWAAHESSWPATSPPSPVAGGEPSWDTGGEPSWATPNPPSWAGAATRWPVTGESAGPRQRNDWPPGWAAPAEPPSRPEPAHPAEAVTATEAAPGTPVSAPPEDAGESALPLRSARLTSAEGAGRRRARVDEEIPQVRPSDPEPAAGWGATGVADPTRRPEPPAPALPAYPPPLPIHQLDRSASGYDPEEPGGRRAADRFGAEGGGSYLPDRQGSQGTGDRLMGRPRAAAPFNDRPTRGVEGSGAGTPSRRPEPGGPESATRRRPESLVDTLPQRVPAEPDVPTVPEPPTVEPHAETPELARIATHLRREDPGAPAEERPDGFDVQAILAAVRGVPGVRDAALRTTPAGAHSLRLELADGADPAEVSRQVARLLQERMGLAAAPQDLPTAAGAGPGDPPSAARTTGAPVPAPPLAADPATSPVPSRRSPISGVPARSAAPRFAPPASAPPASAPPAFGAREPVAPAAMRSAPAQPPEPPGPELPGPPYQAGPDRPGAGDQPAPGQRSVTAHRGRATVGEPPAPAMAEAPPVVGSVPPPGTSYTAGQHLSTTETAPSRPLNPNGPPGPRVLIDHVQVSTFGLEATVEVRLTAGGQRATGLSTGPAVDGYVLRLCAASAALAIDELLQAAERVPEHGRCFVEHAAVLPFGNCEVATVVVLLVCDGWVEQLAGSALVSGDPRQAIVRATLAAVNRRLEALLA